MAVLSGQLTTSAVTAKVIPASPAPGLGALIDPIPVQVKNIDATITVYLGGSAVTSGTGYPLLAGQSISFGFVAGDEDGLYVIAASATPMVAWLSLRQ